MYVKKNACYLKDFRLNLETCKYFIRSLNDGAVMIYRSKGYKICAAFTILPLTSGLRIILVFDLHLKIQIQQRTKCGK